MKKLLFGSLITFASLFSQPQNNFLPIQPIIPFQTGIISFPDSGGNYNVYYTYKIPYRLLVFERQDNYFNASFRIIVEISDNDEKLIKRDIKDNIIKVDNFEETNDPDLLLQDYLNFKINPGEYKFTATVSDMNSSGERPLKPIDIKLSGNSEKVVINPVVVQSNEVPCGNNYSIVLANYGGSIPFSIEEYNLIIPVTDTSLSELKITIENNSEIIKTDTLSDSFLKSFYLAKCDDDLYLAESESNFLTRNFIIKNINQKLNEGEAVIRFQNEEKQIDETISLKVIWFNKPFSLLDPEEAIEYLNAVASDSTIDELLSEDESDYPIALRNYWNKFDPTPETSFNEIMFEYYSRVDYAISEFSSITNKNGAKSDRGKLYIKFGKPDKIERKSDSQGEVLEMWTYSNPQLKFTFIDKIGTGNFILTDNR